MLCGWASGWASACGCSEHRSKRAEMKMRLAKKKKKIDRFRLEFAACLDPFDLLALANMLGILGERE
jgi:hypothetical protein